MPKPETEERERESEQEIISPAADMLDNQTLAVIQRSEIDMQISTAKKYPRVLTQVLNTAIALVTQDEESAADCVYTLVRDRKTIEGPSARFAEAIAYAAGNCRAGARVIEEGEEFVTAMGTCIDLERNVSIAYEVRRRITNREGKRYNSDMIGITANAACSIALRNAVLKVFPRPLWKKVYDQARATIAGNVKTLDTRRAAALKQFQLMGAKPEQVFTLLDVKGVDDITLDHLVTLRGIFNAIREGETTVERAFAPKDTEDKNLAAKSERNLDAIKQKYAPPEAPKVGASQPPTAPTRNGDASAAAAKAGPAPAAPPIQQPDAGSPPASRGVAVEPEDAPGDASSEPPELDEGTGLPPQSQLEVEDVLDHLDRQRQEEHGLPDLFDKPGAKSKHKR